MSSPAIRRTRPEEYDRIYARLGFTRRPELGWSPEPGVALLGYTLDLP